LPCESSGFASEILALIDRRTLGVELHLFFISCAPSYRASRLARNVTTIQLQADCLYSLHILWLEKARDEKLLVMPYGLARRFVLEESKDLIDW